MIKTMSLKRDAIRYVHLDYNYMWRRRGRERERERERERKREREIISIMHSHDIRVTYYVKHGHIDM
jgi:hypothetical protein